MGEFCCSNGTYKQFAHHHKFPDHLEKSVQGLAELSNAQNVDRSSHGGKTFCSIRTQSTEDAHIHFTVSCVEKVSGVSVTFVATWPASTTCRRTSVVGSVVASIHIRHTSRFIYIPAMVLVNDSIEQWIFNELTESNVKSGGLIMVDLVWVLLDFQSFGWIRTTVSWWYQYDYDPSKTMTVLRSSWLVRALALSCWSVLR